MDAPNGTQGLEEGMLLGGQLGSRSKRHVLLLRPLQETRDFSQTIECRPGTITVIVEQLSSSEQVFRNALLGAGAGKVDLRYEDRTAHLSEFLRPDVSQWMSEEWTPLRILQTFGVSRPTSEHVIKALGLRMSGDVSLPRLSRGQFQSFLLFLGFLFRGQFLHLDQPFTEIEGEALEQVGSLVREMASAAQSIVLVTGTALIPDAWMQSPDVRTYIFSGDAKVKVVQGTKSQHPRRSALCVRLLKDEGKLGSGDLGRLVTRPQVINRRTTRRTVETIQCEAIVNPLLDSAGVPIPAVPHPALNSSRCSNPLTVVPVGLRLKKRAAALLESLKASRKTGR